MASQMLSRTQVTPASVAQTRPRAPLAAPAVARLGSVTSRFVAAPVRRAAVSGRRSGRSAVVVTRASETTYEINPENRGDYAPILGIAGLVAWVYNKVNLNAPLLLKTIALYQLGVVAIATLTKKGDTDHIAAVVAPAVLAIAVLNFQSVTYMDAAVFSFGYFVSEHLEGQSLIWLATLVGAIYAGYPSHWYVAASALLAGIRLVRGGQDNKVPVYTVPTLLAAAYAFWKDVTPQFTIALIIGQVLASALTFAEGVLDS